MAKRKAAGAKKKATKAAAPKKTARKATRRAAARTPAAKKKTARKPVSVSRKAVARKAASRKPVSRKASRTRAAKPVARKAPSLDRARRTILGDDILPTPPSSLDLDRSASAARSGRRQMRERLDQHHETSPALTAGDVDADWESAATVGDEAPGGDNPTPDQDIVDDIGKAVGVQYEDNEELKGEEKITKRDKHRWELDPASSEDYEDR
jgi:hypothetical protein